MRVNGSPNTTDEQISKSPSATGKWKSVAVNSWNKLYNDDMFGRAAQLAYYWFFSLFPLMIFLTELLSFFRMSRNLEKWLTVIGNVLPPQVLSIIRDTFAEVTMHERPGLLSLSAALLIWVTSSGMHSVISTLNNAFDAPMTRSWWRERVLAIGLTFGMALFINAALLLIFFGDRISAWLARSMGFGTTFTAIWDVLQWPLVILFVLVGIELIYYFSPNIRQRWSLFTPGAIFALCFWLLISLGFKLYVAYFSNYSALYGAIGGVMVLLLWLYLSGLAILVGGVINSEIRKLNVETQRPQRSAEV